MPASLVGQRSPRSHCVLRESLQDKRFTIVTLLSHVRSLQFRDLFGQLKTEMQKAIVGYDDLLTETLIAIFSSGHVLLEGVPGLGKTFLVRTLSQVIGLEPGRVQCTPDLMPADILGTHIVNENEHGRRVLFFEKGPVFKNLLLVDEINRATPKTQAALLEVMQEHAVTTGGERHVLPKPFFVLATQNPMEMEGTYPLPEAQLDRFMFKIRVPFPDLDSFVEISKRTTGFSEPKLTSILHGKDLIALQHTLAGDSRARSSRHLCCTSRARYSPRAARCHPRSEALCRLRQQPAWPASSSAAPASGPLCVVPPTSPPMTSSASPKSRSGIASS